MAQAISHASSRKPISIPTKANVSSDNWDRCQTFNASINQPTEKLYEIGRLNKMTTFKDTLEASLSISQFEYGTIDSYLQIAGVSAEPSGGVDLDDMDETRTDFYLPGDDEYGGSLEQTLWLPKMVVDSIGIEMDAEDRISRNFEFSGDFAYILKDSNKALNFKTDTAPSGTTGNYDIVLSDPAPVEDPNNTGVYILQIYRIRDGVATELTSDDYTYTDGTNTLQITSAETGDHFRVWYSAGDYGTSGDPASLNDGDDYYIKADNVIVEIDDGTNSAVTLTRLTSLSIDATFNRIEEGVIGDDEKILRDVESYDVSVSLGGYVKNSTIEEALVTQAGQSWGIIDFGNLNTVDVTVKIYDDANKSNFLIGYQVTDCDFSDESRDYNANSFADKPVSLSSDNLKISTTIGDF